MNNSHRTHDPMTGEPVPPASREGRSAVVTYVGLLALIFMVGAPAMYALRAASEADSMVEASLWIAQNGLGVTEDDHSEGSSVTGPVSATSSPWVALLRSELVLGNLNLSEEDSRALSANLFVQMERGGNTMALRLEWPDEDQAVELLDAVAERFATVAHDLKLQNLEEVVEILAGEQLPAIEAQLQLTREDGPAETIEELESLHAAHSERLESARLAVASTIPDVRILSSAQVVDHR